MTMVVYFRKINLQVNWEALSEDVVNADGLVGTLMDICEGLVRFGNLPVVCGPQVTVSL